MRKQWSVLSAAILSAALSPCVYADPWYGLTDLGAYDGREKSSAHSVNDQGQVVGYAAYPQSNRALLFDSTGGGNNTNLGALGTGDPGYAGRAYGVLSAHLQNLKF
mgnify:CR=1 FL=1